jgi:hypothetical protein
MTIFFVTAGLVPAIHVFWLRPRQDVDARDKPGHDEHSSAATQRFHEAGVHAFLREKNALNAATASLERMRSANR